MAKPKDTTNTIQNPVNSMPIIPPPFWPPFYAQGYPTQIMNSDPIKKQ